MRQCPKKVREAGREEGAIKRVLMLLLLLVKR